MTNLIAWTEEMSVGVAILDEDHRRIMKMINMLYLAMQEGKGKQIMTEIIHDLFAYINLYFETEEEMFDQTGYEGGPEQKAEHHKMKTKSLEMKQNFLNAPESVTPIELLVFLKDWWVNHIMHTDKKYATFLNAHGIR